METAKDVLDELNMPMPAGIRLPGDDDGDDEAAEGDSLFLSALGFDMVSLDAIQARTGLPTPDLQARLLELELDGLLMRLPGGLFQRVSKG